MERYDCPDVKRAYATYKEALHEAVKIRDAKMHKLFEIVRTTSDWGNFEKQSELVMEEYHNSFKKAWAKMAPLLE